MVCTKCGKENAEGAVYCIQCGKRLDGRKSCPGCGEWNEEEAVYCARCGKRLDGYVCCPSCGNWHAPAAAFCPICGMSAEKQPVRGGTRSADKPPKQKGASGWSAGTEKVFDIVKTGLLMAVAAMALLFVFLVKFHGAWAYEFFGDAYRTAKETLDALEASSRGGSLNPQVTLATYLPIVCGTVIYAGALVAVSVTAILAIVRCTLHITGREKSGEKLALASFFVYLGASIALISIENLSGRIEGENAAMHFDKPSIAGIVLCCVFLGGYVVMSILSRGKKLGRREVLASLICRAASVVLFTVLLVLLAVPMFAIKEGNDTVRMSHFAANAFVSGSFAFTDSTTSAIVFSVLAIVAFFVLVAAIATSLMKLCHDVSEDGAALASSIATAALVVVLLVLSIVLGYLFVDILNELEAAEESIEIGLGIPITAVVFALLQLGAAITHKILSKKFAEPQLAEATVVA